MNENQKAKEPDQKWSYTESDANSILEKNKKITIMKIMKIKK